LVAPCHSFRDHRSPAGLYPLSLHDALPICHAAHGTRTSTGGRLRGRAVLIGLLSLSLVTAGSSSLATGSTDGLAGEEPTAEAERSEEHTSELQSRENLVCRLLLDKKK